MRAGAGLAAVAVAVAVGPAGAFELLRVDNNPCGVARNLFWPNGEARVDPGLIGGVDLQEVVTRAMDAWNGAAARFRFRVGSGAICESSDGVVGVAFDRVSCGGAALGDVLAVTVFRFDTSTGELANAEVTVNEREPILQRDRALLMEVILHELGHVLGLDHSDACGRAGEGTLMKSSILLSGKRLDAPQADDIAGVNFIYPPESIAEVPEGANSCAVSPGENSRGIWPLTGGMLLLWMMARRKAGFARRARREVERRASRC